MATNRNRADTDQLVKDLLGGSGANEPEANKEPDKAPAPKRVKKVEQKQPQEKKIAVTIYITDDQAVRISEQTGYKKKEKDKSTLARFAFDIALSLTQEEHARLKRMAEGQGVSPGEIMRKAFLLLED